MTIVPPRQPFVGCSGRLEVHETHATLSPRAPRTLPLIGGPFCRPRTDPQTAGRAPKSVNISKHDLPKRYPRFLEDQLRLHGHLRAAPPSTRAEAGATPRVDGEDQKLNAALLAAGTVQAQTQAPAPTQGGGRMTPKSMGEREPARKRCSTSAQGSRARLLSKMSRHSPR